jgi:hypothetical protein
LVTAITTGTTGRHCGGSRIAHPADQPSFGSSFESKMVHNHGRHFARIGELWDERVSSFLRKKTGSQNIMSTSGYRCFFAEVLEKPH